MIHFLVWLCVIDAIVTPFAMALAYYWGYVNGREDEQHKHDPQ